MSMIATDESLTVPFTGWESDRFVRFALLMLERQQEPQVRVIGREPITTTQVNFVGTLVNAVWKGYRRIIVVKTASGTTYQVGGTNATRPIASQAVQFLNVPAGMIHAPELGKLFQDLTQALTSQSDDYKIEIANAAKYTLRIGTPDASARQDLAALIQDHLDAARPELRRSLTELLGLIEAPDVLDPLCRMLANEDDSVRIEAALRFRGMDPVIKSLGIAAPLASRCISSLVTALSDPVHEVRIYAAEDLGYFYNNESITALLACMNSDPEEDVRWAATIALGRTNRQDIARHLAQALRADTAVPIQQAAMLGLGRIGPRVIGSDGSLIDTLAKTLCQLMGSHECQVKDYAAYTIGQLGRAGVECLGLLVESVRPEQPFELKSNAVLSLSKLLEYYHNQQALTSRLQQLLADNLSLTRPSDWPSCAYFDWFLVGAAELASLMELHELANGYYVSASSAFEMTPWLSSYYQAIGLYESAEQFCVREELANAHETLGQAIELFEKVETSQDYRRESDSSDSGLQFKTILAKARLSIVGAALRWSVAVPRDADYIAIKNHFDEAVRQYRLIDVIGVSEQTEVKTLTRQEATLVVCLTRLSDIGSQLISLKKLSRALDNDRLAQAMGRLRQEVVHFVDIANTSRSSRLRDVAQTLKRLVDATYARQTVGTFTITEIAEEFVEAARQIFFSSFPTPGNCPVIRFGTADLSMKLKGSVTGDGSQAHPFVFPADSRIVFDASVSRIRRTKNDILFFRGLNPPAGARDVDPDQGEVVQEIPVHEGTYALRPVDYGQLAPNFEATPFDFILEFRNQGCGQPVSHQRMWVRIFDPREEFSTRASKLAARIEFIDRMTLEDEAHRDQLKKVRDTADSSAYADLDETIRMIDIRLSTSLSELEDLQEQSARLARSPRRG